MIGKRESEYCSLRRVLLQPYTLSARGNGFSPDRQAQTKALILRRVGRVEQMLLAWRGRR